MTFMDFDTTIALFVHTSFTDFTTKKHDYRCIFALHSRIYITLALESDSLAVAVGQSCKLM